MSTRVRKKEILSDDFKKRKIFWKIFHLTSLGLSKTLGKVRTALLSSFHVYIFNDAISLG
jgi:hypothetical protein